MQTPSAPATEPHLDRPEMTGLNPTDRIIEIAVVVTNANLEKRVEGPVFAIHQATPRSTAWTPGTRARTARAA